MLAPEYVVGLRVLIARLGLFGALRVAIPAYVKATVANRKARRGLEEAEPTKAALKNHFRPLAYMYQAMEKRHGEKRTEEVMRDVLLQGGDTYFRGFTKLGPQEKLGRFVEIHKAFESKNILFDVLVETDSRFEIEIRRCLVYEAFNELGVPGLTKWMCDIAFEYFSRYHPQMTYEKDRMIARGATSCHEVFTWK
jgi:hypothetical protein